MRGRDLLPPETFDPQSSILDPYRLRQNGQEHGCGHSLNSYNLISRRRSGHNFNRALADSCDLRKIPDDFGIRLTVNGRRRDLQLKSSVVLACDPSRSRSRLNSKPEGDRAIVFL